MVEKKTTTSKKKVAKKAVKKKPVAKKNTKGKISKKILLREDKQLLWFFGIIAFIFALFLGSYFYVQNQNHFTYAGVEWTKTQAGELTVYHSLFRLGEGLPAYNAYLRNDPRKLKHIEIEGTLGGREKAIVTYDPSVDECRRETSIMGITHGIFLSALKIETDFSYVDEERAESNGLEAVTCDDASNKQTIFYVREGEESSIVQNPDNANCYYFNVANCEAIEVGERFIIGVLGKVGGVEI